ncbi:MAG: DoxX family membrane protein [bacterium]|nr:DoxX family membrane protein [bacterium]
MQRFARPVLRTGLGITFVWIGILILQDPLAWGGYLEPWAVSLLPMPLEQVMVSTGVLDIVIGVFLIVNLFPWIAALAATVHLVMVLLTSGFTAVTVRDIGLLGAAMSLLFFNWQKKLAFRG